MVDLSLWYGLFRSLVVLVGALDCAVHANKARAYLSGIREYLVDSHLVSGYPPSVQPENVQFSVLTSSQLIELVLSVFYIALPPFRMLLDVIVRTAVGSSVVWVPESLVMPVRLGKVCPYHKAFSTEGVKHIL